MRLPGDGDHSWNLNTSVSGRGAGKALHCHSLSLGSHDRSEWDNEWIQPWKLLNVIKRPPALL